MTILKEIVLQLFFALMPFIMFNVYYRDKTQNYNQKFINITSTLCLFFSMSFGASVTDGIFYDVRYIIMFFGLVFGGLQTGFILLAEFVLYRFYLGGEGKWIAMIIMMLTFPMSILLYKVYQNIHRKTLIILTAGIVFSLIPLIIMYQYNPNYVIENLAFHILAIPIQNSIGIWMQISLFKKSVSDKELFIRYAQNEKVKAISHVAASLVHEVRNPLTAVKGFLKLIRESSLARDKVERYIDICVDEIQRTEYILSEYLSISKPLIERREPTDLLQQLQVIMDVMKPYSNMNNVLIEIDLPVDPIWIFANPDKIKQILVNFIKNAVEACSEVPNGKVFLRIHVVARKVLLTIKDNGIGMNAEQINHLGTIYFSTKTSGTGLGLTFSYQVIHALGGTVSVRSEPRAGTQFTITLPLLVAVDLPNEKTHLG